MPGTIINHSETLSGLQVNALDTTTVEQASGTPAGDPVFVRISALELGLGSTLLVRNGATLDLASPAHVNAASSIDIGQNGTLELNSTVGINILSDISFTGAHATLAVDPATAHSVLSPTSTGVIGGVIGGFAPTDTIQMNGLGGVASAVWHQGLLGSGSLSLLGASGQQVGSVGLYGTYATSQFHVQADSAGTAITLNSASPGTPSPLADILSALSHTDLLPPITVGGPASASITANGALTLQIGSSSSTPLVSLDTDTATHAGAALTVTLHQ